MGTVQSTVTIARPVEDVYSFLLALDENATDPDTESVVKEPPGPTAPGTTFRFRHKGRGDKVRETTMQFTALEPNRRIAFSGDVGPVRPEGAFFLEPADGGGTKLSVRIDKLNPVGPLKLLSPVLALVGRRIWDGRLQRIKAANESSAP
jgi:hypothetical protein